MLFVEVGKKIISNDIFLKDWCQISMVHELKLEIIEWKASDWALTPKRFFKTFQEVRNTITWTLSTTKSGKNFSTLSDTEGF